MQVYPNPVHDLVQLEIDCSETSDYIIMIKDISGRNLMKKSIPKQNVVELDVSFLKSGVYFINLYNENRLLTTKKLIKQ